MRAFFTDLDGTLRDPEHGIHPLNLVALRELGRRGIPRVVVTGRSLYHVRKVLPPETPLDWLIFASGAGYLKWPDGPPHVQPGLSAERVRALTLALEPLPLSYSIHAPAPESHRFHYRQHADDVTDFARRLERNREHGQPLQRAWTTDASQVLLFAPPQGDWPDRLRRDHADLRLLHSTSPLDGHSLWIELQPREVCKSRGAALLLEQELGGVAADCRALGNDFNDLDLLEWAGASAVVGNAPPELRARFAVVADCVEGGAAQAIQGWLDESAC